MEVLEAIAAVGYGRCENEGFAEDLEGDVSGAEMALSQFAGVIR